jgi:hypothetical protein
MKKGIVIILFILSVTGCQGQIDNKAFDAFLSKFTEYSFPLNPIDFFVNREAELKTTYILEKDYNEFLRIKGDTFWQFNNDFQYRYGGKLKLNNYWLLFYRRDFMPDDINKQKGEVILSTFTLAGKIISNTPIAGGYGDSITFSSNIIDSKTFDINYIKYIDNKEVSYTKGYSIDNEGNIILNKN